MRLPRFFRSEDRKSEIDEEIAAHLALAAADKRERGADDASAQQQAQREFGNTALIKDITREAQGWLWLERLQQDFKYAFRQMRKSPGFAAAVIGTLALGIAAPTAMFTVVDRVLLRPLPYKRPSQLVEIKEATDLYESVPYLDLEQWRKWSRSFNGIGYYGPGTGRHFLEGRTATESVDFYRVSSNLFSVVGVRPPLGRDFRDQTDSFAHNPDEHSVLLSDAAWREMFGADPKVVGRSVNINDAPYLVAGIMPRGFSFPFAPNNLQVWTLNQLGDSDKGRTDSTPRYLAIGRLKKDVSLDRAQAELKTLQVQIAKGYVDPDAQKEYSTVSLHKYSASLVDTDTRRALEMLLAASGMLWLIACVNVTNLLLARAMVRQREIAMRGALGARHGRILQQFAAEGLLFSSCGAVVGLGLALLAVNLFAHAIKRYLPLPVRVVPDTRLLLALFILTVVSALVASMWPAWMAARAPIEPVLKQGGMQSGSAHGQNRLRNVLVVIEIALSLTLLAGCGLMLRTIYALSHVPLGFRTDHIVVANLEIPAYKFSGRNMTANLYLPLLERAKHLPGVQAAGLMSEVPLGQTFNVELTLDGKDSELFGTGPKTVHAKLNAVSPELQKVFHFKMLAGRFFNEEDTASSVPVFVVNRAFVHAYAPAERDLRKVVGRKISHLTPNGKQAEIVGVLDDFRQAGVALNPEPEFDIAIPQITPESGLYRTLEGIAMDLTVRTRRPLAQVVPELRSALRQASPELANSNITTMDQIVEDSYGSQMLAARLLEIFAGSALLLCVAGLYGLLAYVVSQRTREMGVRFALGAQRGDVIWLVLRQAGALVLTGVVLGLAFAYASTRFIRSYLYGVSAHDAWTLAAVAAVLLASGAVAAYLPARRAAQVDPVEALRAE